MFMILIIHANFVSLPRFEYDELISNTSSSLIRFLIESFGIVAVNIFVFISGWFGINTRKKSVLSFIYLILFYLGGGYILFIILKETSFSFEGILDVFQFTSRGWFVKAYLLLMILAPVLNSFCKNSEEKTQRYVVIAFLLFEAVYGWVGGSRSFFDDGYGPFHFIGLYLLAQYVHNQINNVDTPNLIKKLVQLPKWADLGVFVVTIIINTCMVYYGSLFMGKVTPVFNATYAYSNPFVIIGAFYLLLFFSKLNIPHNKVINWLGASSFAVYLSHSEPTVRERFFTPQIQFIYHNFSGFSCLFLIFVFLCSIYLISVLIDQLRLLSWNNIWSLFDKNSSIS